LEGHHREAIDAPFQQTFARCQIKLALRFFAAVAFQATFEKKRANFLLKQFQAALHALGVIGRQRSGTENGSDRKKKG
jgi:hypothetical protein